ncbi:ran-binding protein 9-like [Artemia franciscana]|uniref:Ran-binding protein 9 n=1 Tax=Artemia franciscana TaxID=6661 RepID=A0AA88HDL1_ARTSF|nr:hypothetical protein QYM36_014114 [Artemia franciscana]KAK2708394.1 hypothetical protein QYM36_014114 [Artemia franciscana]
MDRIKQLYHLVDESETPLPRAWSPVDKYQYISLSQNNLRAQYKGKGQSHKDAASVRATNPIPASCGLYYFEVKIVSKGRDGYMGIGLSIQGVSTNRLPGWDKYSYGYHGDDGHSFCSSGNGKTYGPTFTTDDVIGCAVNLMDGTCYYTKNGVNLGIAFTDLPANLYPTVGMQTVGEIIDANFGQAPFVYDIENDRRELVMQAVSRVDSYVIPDRHSHQSMLQKMIQSYLVHHGFSATAETFARSTGQEFTEDLVSIRNRQKIQRLVLAGRISEAIETTQRLYSGILEKDHNLLFRLKVRQFIEMIAGADSEVKNLRSPKVHGGSPSSTPLYGTSYTSPQSQSGSFLSNPGSFRRSRSRSKSPTVQQTHPSVIQSTRYANGKTEQSIAEVDGDVDMEGSQTNGQCSNGVQNGSSVLNGAGTSHTSMDVQGSAGKQLCGGTSAALEKTLTFGRELQAFSNQLKEKYGKNETNKKMIENAFSLIAYVDPWSSKAVGWQLEQSQREILGDILNSAIVENYRMPGRPPLEEALAHGCELGNLMIQSGNGIAAFLSVKGLLEQDS